MKLVKICSTLFLFMLLATASFAQQKFEYPKTNKSNQLDEYHGVKVADPYRWLEEDSAETKSWVEAQNKLTFSYLNQIPQREVLKKRLTELWN